MCSRDWRLVRVQVACVHSKTGVQRCSGVMAAQEPWMLTRAVLALRWMYVECYLSISSYYRQTAGVLLHTARRLGAHLK